jgi:predicted nucleic acid-binding protein
MTEHCIQKLIMDVEDQIDKILETVTDKDEILKLTEHEIRARKKLARDLYFSIQYYDLRNHQ